MVRLSRDANRLNRDRRPLVAFAKESCVELPAGGKKLFMRPQCVRHTQTGGSSGSVYQGLPLCVAQRSYLYFVSN